MPPLNIFLDDGGVITDKQRRAAEFGRLVGDYFLAQMPHHAGGQDALDKWVEICICARKGCKSFWKTR